MAYYGVQWSEFNRRDELVNKRRGFASITARDRFIKHLEAKPNFNRVDAICQGV